MASLSHPGEPPGADEARIAKALGLIVTADVAETAVAAQARERLERWRRRSAVNAQACAEALRRWQHLGHAAEALNERLADPLGRPARRRELLGLLLVGGGAAAFAALRRGPSAEPEPPLFADAWQTAPRQLLRLSLPDARAGRRSELVLSADTSLRAALYADRREVDLLRGEARFDVVADAARPFVVSARAAEIRVVGTAFTVADRGGLLTVAVEHGAVRVTPRRGGDADADTNMNTDAKTNTSAGRLAAEAVELGPGDALTLGDDGRPGRLRRVATEDIASWRTGWLVFDDVALAEAVPAINAFRSLPLTLADAATGRLRLTARLHALDEPALLGALPAALPVRLVPGPTGVRIERLR